MFSERKKIRLKDYDYSSSGTYFITICVQSSTVVLSTIVGEGSPLPKLSPFGKIVEEWISQISDKYKDVMVDCYVIMPNHLHILLTVKKSEDLPTPSIDAVVGWLKFQITREINRIQGGDEEKIFQRSFYDHIIRNRRDYEEIWKYIHENPLRWHLDRFFSEG